MPSEDIFFFENASELWDNALKECAGVDDVEAQMLFLFSGVRAWYSMYKHVTIYNGEHVLHPDPRTGHKRYIDMVEHNIKKLLLLNPRLKDNTHG